MIGCYKDFNFDKDQRSLKGSEGRSDLTQPRFSSATLLMCGEQTEVGTGEVGMQVQRWLVTKIDGQDHARSGGGGEKWSDSGFYSAGQLVGLADWTGWGEGGEKQRGGRDRCKAWPEMGSV